MPLLRQTSRRAFLLSGLAAAASVSPGCGTLLYPERRGQPAGRLDWGVVLLNGIGLLLFFIPGVIAFAVDFSNGTIYLPPDEYGTAEPPAGARPPLRSLALSRPRPSLDELEDVLHRETGVDVELRRQEFISRELASVDEFWDVRAGMCRLSDGV
jgi:hypothetical protein